MSYPNYYPRASYASWSAAMAAANLAIGAPTPTPTPDLALTFGVEPLVGWRVWKIADYERRGGVTEPRLHPISARGMIWQPRVRAAALCTAGLHDAPWLTCMCGLWALRERVEAERIARGQVMDGAAAFGPVFLWGRVLEFDKGYRAQYAYPRELFVYGGNRGPELERVYAVPVKTLEAPKPLAPDDLSAQFAALMKAQTYAIQQAMMAPPPSRAARDYETWARKRAERSERKRWWGK